MIRATLNVMTLPEKTAIMKDSVGRQQNSDPRWQTASDRALLYLRCLDVPAPRALELALEAIKTAERALASDSGASPTQEVMKALNSLLLEEENPDVLIRSRALTGHYPAPSTPPLQRLPMTSNENGPAIKRSALSGNLSDYRKKARAGL